MNNKKLSNCLLYWTAFYIPFSNEWEFLLLYTVTSIWYYQLVDFNHSNRCVVIFNDFSDLQLTNDKWHWVSFHMFTHQLYIIYLHITHPSDSQVSPSKRKSIFLSSCTASLHATMPHISWAYWASTEMAEERGWLQSVSFSSLAS